MDTGDTLTSIAAGLATAVNADANLAAVGIVAYSNAAVISLSTAKGNTTTFTESVSTGGTETIAVAAGLKLTTTYGYDTVGNTKTVKDALNNTTTFVFDKSRRLMTRTEATPFSYVTMYGYDKNNNLSSVQRQTGNTMNPEQTYTIAYTLSDKVFTVTDPALNVTTKTYDNFDRLWTVTDAQLKKTTFAYDQRSKLFTVTDSSNTISETRTYTNNGKLYQLSDARSETTTYSYDGFDRANKTTYADTSFEQHSSYDANNNVLAQLTRSGALITNTYDPLNRLSTKAPQGQATVTNLYDLSGRLVSATTPVVSGNPATGVFGFSYDTAGRLIQEKTPDSKTVKYGLDKNSNLTKLTYPDAYFVTRVYDQLNRLTDIKLNGATTSAINITYDELSRRAVLTYGNGATSTYTFQLNDDLTTLAEAFIGSSVTLTYGFNKVHQETSRAVTDGTYLWHPSAGGTTTYAAANSVNEYPTVGGTGYLYDGNGNLKSDGTWTYVYDTENHLLSANKTGVSASYVYDGLHRQIQKTVGSTNTRFYYGGLQRLADYNGATLQTRHIYGVGLDQALIEVSSSGVLTYLHSDRLGSIIATSNAAGNVVSEFAYGPYGESPSLTGTTFGFSGQRYDLETGLYYYKLRYYSPAIGRFLQTDPAGYQSDTTADCGCGCACSGASTPTESALNLYQYVDSDPLNLIDPLGLAPTVAPVAPVTPTTPTGGTASAGAGAGAAGSIIGGLAALDVYLAWRWYYKKQYQQLVLNCFINAANELYECQDKAFKICNREKRKAALELCASIYQAEKMYCQNLFHYWTQM